MGYSFNWSAVSSGAPYVTLSMLGIAFNTVSIEMLGTPDEIMVGFDADALVIGVKPYKLEYGDAKKYPFAVRIKNGWVRIGCRDFIKYLGTLTNTDFSKAHKYVAEEDKEDGCLIVKLQQKSDKRDIIEKEQEP